MNKEDFLKIKKETPDKEIVDRLQKAAEQVEFKLFDPEKDGQEWQEFAVFREILASIKAICRKHNFPNVPVSLTESIAAYNRKQLQKLRTQIIPELFNDLGISEVKTKNGKTIKIDLCTSVSVIDEEGFYTFLEKNGLKNKIKYTYVLGKGEDIKKLNDFFEEEGYTVEFKKGIHYKTRISVIENLAKEKIFPSPDIAEVKVFEIAKIS